MLDVKNLSIYFNDRKGDERAVNHISFSLKEGEILGIVGESGSGKTLTALTVAGILKRGAIIEEGQVYFDGTDLLTLTDSQMRQYQGEKISMIFQEPMTALNPTMKIGRQVEEALRLHTNLSSAERRQKALEAMADAELDDVEELYGKYPHELSGGMRQRVMIAAAIVCRPRLLIADEPTTALDVNTQAGILALLKKLNRKYGMGILFISHNLRIVRELCSRILVMKGGEIVEEGMAEEIFTNPRTEYTKELIRAIPTAANAEKWRKADNAARKADAESSARKVGGAVNGTDTESDARKANNAVSETDAESSARKADNATNKADATSSAREKKKILQLTGVSAYYREGQNRRRILEDVNLTLYEGEIAGLVGESGSGKSTLCKCILGLLPDYEGQVTHFTNRPQMVFQDPYRSLNPRKKIGWILEEALRAQKKGTKRERKEAALSMLTKVHLSEEIAARYPSELSGGQRQRVSIALSLIAGTKFILADEPLSALDVTVQAQIIELLRELQRTERITCLLVSHDLNVVSMLCQRVFRIQDGKVTEVPAR